MYSPEPVETWDPPDFDPRDVAAAAAMAPSAGAARGGTAVIATGNGHAGWSPPPLESRRAAPAGPPRGEQERAFERGYTEGRTAGREEGQADVAPVMGALERMMGKLNDAESEFTRERERNLTAMALVVARKLVQQEMDARPDVLQSLVARALDLVPPTVPAEVRLNPDDLESLVPSIEKLALEGRGPALQWVGDTAIPRGSFMVDSPARIVDGRIDTALKQLYERLDHE